MSSKKGKKKVKGKTLNLAEFQQSGQNQPSGTGKNIVSLPTNWADESLDDEFGDYKEPQKIALPSAPRAAQKEIDYKSLPDSPPYTVYVGNLSYDVDEEILRKFFGDQLEIIEVRFVSEQGRMKGFGYVEFGSKQHMIAGLEKDGETLLKRGIKIDVASGNNNKSQFDSERGGYRQQQQFTSFGDDDNDWRGGSNRAPPTDYGRGYDSGRRDDGFSRRDDGFGRKDDGFGRSDDRYPRRQEDDSSNDGPWTRGVSSGYTEAPPRRNYNDDRNGFDRSERAPRRDDAPQERPRLKLAPRSKPAEEGDTKPASQSSIFGDAKPVDTASKERQIEERLHHQHIDDRGSDRQRTRDGDSGFASRDIRQNVERRPIKILTRRVNGKVYNAAEDPPSKDREPEPAQPAQPVQPKKPSFDPFGAAKPVDTAAREREIEEKLKMKEAESRPARDADSRSYRDADSRSYRDGDSRSYRDGDSRSYRDADSRSHRDGNPRPYRDVNPRPYRDGDSRPPHRDQARQDPLPRDAHSNRGAKIESHKPRAKPIPQSIDEMPKYTEDRQVEFKMDNKYAHLLGDGSDREDSD